MKEVHVRDAVGLRLAHDLTRIVPGEFKGRIFQKGHKIRQEDIPALLDIGKEHIYILELAEGDVHEEDAAIRLARAVQGENLAASEPSEGKVVLKSSIHGLLKIDSQALRMLNSINEIVVATKKHNTVVKAGDTAAAMKAVPLVVEEQKLVEAETISRMYAPVIEVVPFRKLRAAIITTGSELASGRIKDKFGPVLQAKLAHYGIEPLGQTIVGDSKQEIQSAIEAYLTQGAELILCTGGMSVDPDDRTPGAIRELCTELVTYGMPIFPGSMMLLAYIGNIPVFGLPGAVIYEEITAFDLILPRILAGDKVAVEDIIELGHGGLLT